MHYLAGFVPARLSRVLLNQARGMVTTLGNHTGDYYLDLVGGSDLGPRGIGTSYELHTGPLADRFTGLSAPYITSFEPKWMDADGNLRKITVSPTLFKEVFLPTASPGGARAIPLLPGPWLAALIALLAGLLVWRRFR